MDLLVDLGGILLIGFIVAWFWLYRPAAAAPVKEGIVDILVADGVYSPSEVSVPVGRETVLRFLRRDRSPCAATVLIDDLGISAELAVDKPVEVRVRPPRPGRYEFTCQMRMYRGTLVAVEETA